MGVVTFENQVYGDDSFPATEKVYDSRPYDVTFAASVVTCHAATNPKDGSRCFAVLLDRTLFFPEQGGQTCDNGTLEPALIDEGTSFTDLPAGNFGDISSGRNEGTGGGSGRNGETQGSSGSNSEEYEDAEENIRVNVLHVGIDEKTGIITHYCDGAFSAGDRVKGHIDFAHRFSNMQNHTGEHIFSGLVHTAFGYNNVGFHLSDDIVTMDYDGVLSPEEVAAIEYRTNEAIWKNVPVRCFYPSEPELEELDYRSKKELSGPIRIVEVEGYDICACCAPHVKRTGEIGELTVLSAINYKGGTRLSILCGKRAYEYMAGLREQARAVSQSLSVPVNAIASAAEKQLAEKGALKQEIAALQQKILAFQLAQVPSAENNVILFTEASDNVTIRNAVNDLTGRHAGYVMLLSGGPAAEGGPVSAAKSGPAQVSAEAGKAGGRPAAYRFILGSAKKDCKAALSTLQQTLSAKGGGTREMVQGTISAPRMEIEEAFSRLS